MLSLKEEDIYYSVLVQEKWRILKSLVGRSDLQYLAPAGSFIIQNLRAQWTADTSVLATNVKYKNLLLLCNIRIFFSRICISKLYLRQSNY